MNKFCILMFARVGSTYFCRVLNSNQQLMALGEMFNPGGLALSVNNRDEITFVRKLRANLGDDYLTFRQSDPLAFLEACFEIVSETFPRIANAGIKFSFTQNPAVLDAVLEDPAIKKILLYRENFLSVYSSEILARQTGVYHVTSSPEEAKHGVSLERATQPQRIDFVASQFLARYETYIGLYENARNAMRRSNQNWLEMEYRRIFSRSAYSDVATYLDVIDNFDFQATSLRKINPANPLRRFVNQEEVIETVRKLGKFSWLSPELTGTVK